MDSNASALPTLYGAAQIRTAMTHVTYAMTMHATQISDARSVPSTQNASTAGANVNRVTTNRMSAHHNVFQNGVMLSVGVDSSRNQLLLDTNVTHAQKIVTHAPTIVLVNSVQKSSYSTEMNASAMVGSSKMTTPILMKDVSAQSVLKRKMESA